MAPQEPRLDRGQEKFIPMEMSWTELLSHARYWRNRTRGVGGPSVTQLQVMRTEKGQDRVLGLGCCNEGQQVLLVADLPRDGETTSNVQLWPFHNTIPCSPAPMSKEQHALCERQRASIVSGVTAFCVHPNEDSLLFTCSSQLFYCSSSTGDVTIQLAGDVVSSLDAIQWTHNKHHRDVVVSPLDAIQCPADSNLVAFVSDGEIFIARNGHPTGQITQSQPGITNGSPSFVTEEEMDRYTGMWWSPSPCRYLLYERVDNRAVTQLQFVCPGTEPEPPMRYPLAGTTNARSTLRMLDVNSIDETIDMELSIDLLSVFPDFEYLLRAGWTRDAEAVWALLINRDQNHSCLVLIPRSLFSSSINAKVSSTSDKVIILHEEHSTVWINCHNLTRFIHHDDHSVTFIHSSERTDFSHLYLKKVIFDNGTVIESNETVITHGDWPVIRSAGLCVDEIRGHVYFVAHKLSPIEASLCVASYTTPSECRLLTVPGQSYRSDRPDQTLNVNPEVGFACWTSSLSDPPSCTFYRLYHRDDDLLPMAIPICRIMKPVGLCKSISMSDLEPEAIATPVVEVDQLSSSIPFVDDPIPEIIDFDSELSGRRHYALLLRPHGWRPATAYPVIHYVYGGPGVQMVRNLYSFSFHKFASLGYAVVMVDGRGSANRGLSFEAPLKYAMGTVELLDQLEGLRAVANRCDGLLDLSRVCLMGWSYGGYMALLGMSRHSDTYRAAVAGAGVTSWRLYDTAYTERYMGPVRDPVYSHSSVLEHIWGLPDQPNRLLILHGLIDENVHFHHTERLLEALIKAGKPYQLQLFPSERHGIRSAESSEFMDATVLQFVQTALRLPS